MKRAWVRRLTGGDRSALHGGAARGEAPSRDARGEGGDAFEAEVLRVALSGLATDVAHDLSGPLLLLRTLTALELPAPTRAAIQEETARLEGVMRRLRARRARLAPETEVALCLCVEGALRKVSSVAEKRLRVEVLAPSTLTVLVSELPLEVMLVVLLRRAARECAEEGVLRIRASATTGGCEVEVAVSGSGTAWSEDACQAVAVAQHTRWRVDAVESDGWSCVRVRIPGRG